MAIESYNDLEVYQEAKALAAELFDALEEFPADQRFRMVDQLQRCSMGVGAHIAEGWGRKASAADFKRFLRMALGDIQETKYWIEMSVELGFIESDEGRQWWRRYDELGARLYRLIEGWESHIE